MYRVYDRDMRYVAAGDDVTKVVAEAKEKRPNETLICEGPEGAFYIGKVPVTLG